MSEIDALNRANPNTIPDHFRNFKLGSWLAGRTMQLRKKFNFDVSGNNGRHVATVDCMPLDNRMKAAQVVRAYARAGAVTGELTVAAASATPTTGQIAVAPNGDIVALATDAITDCDVYYQPIELEEREIIVPVVAGTGVGLLPAGVTARGVFYLASAVVTAGGVLGERRILAPGAVNPATGNARLSVAKDAVNFTVADAVTSATCKVLVLPSTHLLNGQEIDLYSLLTGQETII